MFGGNFAPQGWAFCDGSLIPIVENEVLFSLIGTTYGGDGVTTFALPDLRGRALVHQGTNPRTGTNYVLGQRAGTETVTLTATQMPAHQHVVVGQLESGSVSEPSGAFFADSSGSAYSNQPPTAAMAANLVTPAGGNQPHDNMMPFLALNFIIATEGVYPSQS